MLVHEDFVRFCLRPNLTWTRHGLEWVSTTTLLTLIFNACLISSLSPDLLYQLLKNILSLSFFNLLFNPIINCELLHHWRILGCPLSYYDFQDFLKSAHSFFFQQESLIPGQTNTRYRITGDKVPRRSFSISLRRNGGESFSRELRWWGSAERERTLTLDLYLWQHDE